MNTYVLNKDTTLTFTLDSQQEYILLINKQYMWQMTKQSGSGTLNGQKYIFNSGSPTQTYEHSFLITNGYVTNNHINV